MSWKEVYYNNYRQIDKIKQVRYTDTKSPQYTVRIYVDRSQNCFQYDVQPSQSPVVKVVMYHESNYLRLGFLAMIAAMKDILAAMGPERKAAPKPTVRFVFQNAVYQCYIENANRLAMAQKLSPSSPSNRRRKPQNMEVILRFLLLNHMFSIQPVVDRDVYKQQFNMR